MRSAVVRLRSSESSSFVSAAVLEIMIRPHNKRTKVSPLRKHFTLQYLASVVPDGDEFGIYPQHARSQFERRLAEVIPLLLLQPLTQINGHKIFSTHPRQYLIVQSEILLELRVLSLPLGFKSFFSVPDSFHVMLSGCKNKCGTQYTLEWRTMVGRARLDERGRGDDGGWAQDPLAPACTR